MVGVLDTMCDIGQCVLEMIPNAPKCECKNGCFFNTKVMDRAIEELETTEIKTEGIMFDGILKVDKRKR